MRRWPGAVEREAPHIARVIEAIAERLRRGGRLIYVGAGTSGRLGALDAAECPPTFHVPTEMVVACIAGGPIALGHTAEELFYASGSEVRTAIVAGLTSSTPEAARERLAAHDNVLRKALDAQP